MPNKTTEAPAPSTLSINNSLVLYNLQQSFQVKFTTLLSTKDRLAAASTAAEAKTIFITFDDELEKLKDHMVDMQSLNAFGWLMNYSDVTVWTDDLFAHLRPVTQSRMRQKLLDIHALAMRLMAASQDENRLGEGDVTMGSTPLADAENEEIHRQISPVYRPDGHKELEIVWPKCEECKGLPNMCLRVKGREGRCDFCEGSNRNCSLVPTMPQPPKKGKNREKLKELPTEEAGDSDVEIEVLPGLPRGIKRRRVGRQRLADSPSEPDLAHRVPMSLPSPSPTAASLEAPPPPSGSTSPSTVTAGPGLLQLHVSVLESQLRAARRKNERIEQELVRHQEYTRAEIRRQVDLAQKDFEEERAIFYRRISELDIEVERLRSIAHQ